MLKRTLILAFWAAALAVPLAAQLAGPYNTFHRRNWQLINPAAVDPILYYNNDADNNPDIMLAVQSRRQWIGAGIEGSPFFGLMSGEYAPDGQNWKLGYFLNADQVGAFRQLSNCLNFSYEILKPIKKADRSVSLGFGLDIVSQRIDLEKIRLADPADLPLIADGFQKPLFVRVPVGFFTKKGLYGAYGGLSLSNGLGFEVNPKNDLKAWRNFEGARLDATVGKQILLLNSGGGPNVDGLFEWTFWARWGAGLSYSSLFENGFPLAADLSARYYSGELIDKKYFWLGAGTGSHRQFYLEAGHSWRMNDENNQRLSIGFSGGAPLPFRQRLRLGTSFEVSAQLTFY